MNKVLVQHGTDSFLVNLFFIQLVGFDMVLGVKWVSTLGPIWWDFHDLTMKYFLHGKEVLC